MYATIDADSFLLSGIERSEGQIILSAACLDYEAFQALPKVLRFEDRLFALTGWNSDRGRAYWKPSSMVAQVVS